MGTEPTTEATLAELERLEKEATPAPWKISEARREDDWPRLVWDDPNDPREDDREMVHISDLDDGVGKQDRDLIVYLRNHARALIDAARIVMRRREPEARGHCHRCKTTIWSNQDSNVDNEMEFHLTCFLAAGREEAQELAKKLEVVARWYAHHSHYRGEPTVVKGDAVVERAVPQILMDGGRLARQALGLWGEQVWVDNEKRANRLAEAARRASEGPDSDPAVQNTGDYRVGLHAGLEDADITDRYEAVDHGFQCGVERALEWVKNELAEALEKEVTS